MKEEAAGVIDDDPSAVRQELIVTSLSEWVLLTWQLPSPAPHLAIAIPRYNDHLKPQATEPVIQPLLLADRLTATRGGGRPLMTAAPRTEGVSGDAPSGFPGAGGQTVLPLNEVLEGPSTRHPIQTGRIACTKYRYQTSDQLHKASTAKDQRNKIRFNMIYPDAIRLNNIQCDK